MSILMADISSYQHNNAPDNPVNDINYEKAAREGGIKALIIKATEGTTYVNPWLSRDAYDAMHSGITNIGYYHFAHPSISSAQDQAAFFLHTIEGLPRSIGAVLDLETQTLPWDQMSAWARAFLGSLSDTITDIRSRTLYSNLNFLLNMPGAPWNHNLWFADPGAPSIRRHCWAWQYTWQGNIPGIPNPVDLSHLYG